MALGILCSGQGRQHSNMFALTGDVPEAANLFAHAAALLDGRDPRELVRTATSEVLHHNRTGQILCTLEALAAATALRSALPDKVVVAGYSVGEVAGWGVAGVLAQTDTLDLVTRRAEAMDTASSAGEGMLFVRGLSRQSVDRLCEQHDAAIAIVNPGDAFVVGGTLTALDALAREAQFMHAARVVAVPVEVASHTPRLAKASMRFREMPEPSRGDLSADWQHAPVERHRWAQPSSMPKRVSTSWPLKYRERFSGPIACSAASRPERPASWNLAPDQH